MDSSDAADPTLPRAVCVVLHAGRTRTMSLPTRRDGSFFAEFTEGIPLEVGGPRWHLYLIGIDGGTATYRTSLRRVLQPSELPGPI